jgi:ribonuclease R
MALRYTKRLLAHMTHASYEPSDINRLAADLGVPEDERESFAQAVQELAGAGQVVLGGQGLVTLPPIGSELVGSFKRNPKGFGFIIPQQANEHGDLFVPAPETLDAMTGDTVRAEVLHRPRRGGKPGQSPYVGRIVEVIERRQGSFTGELTKSGGQWIVHPDGKAVTEPVVVKDAESKNAREGDKVVFEITQYAEGDWLAEGVIVRVLGASGEPDVETAAVIEAFGLPGEFPDACSVEARQLAIDFDERMRDHTSGDDPFDPDERLDMRDQYVLTIDPPDAKDYDDALSIERLDEVAGGGPGWRLGVHIADVSNFVTPGTVLDDEAKDRCNSVYLPRLVIPMLPEVLSNGICSLQEGVPRFCKSVFIDYDDQGNVRGRGYSATIIESNKRLTYLEAQALIEGNEVEARTHARTEPAYTKEMAGALKHMNALSRVIRERRRKNGMIHLDLPDVELIFNDEGRVVDAEPEDDAYTHTLIEMFMVEANEAVARLFEELGVPVLRRIHPEPVPGAQEQLRDFVKVAGFRIPKSPTREELQALLDATSGSPAAPAVHFAVLRTLTRAEYSPALIGHYALASEAYAHFTSPIRRYPDLTVHRAFTKYLELTGNGNRAPRSEGEKKQLGKKLKETNACPDEPTLVQIGNKCNLREENATNAERELRQFLVLQLLGEHIGESFAGLVTGVSPAGVFVRLDKYLAEGLVKTSDLPVPRDPKKPHVYQRALWRLDRKTGALVEVNSGRSFNIGDRIDVTVTEVDLPRRQMELVVTEGESRAVGKAKKLSGGGTGPGGDAAGGGLAAGLRIGDAYEDLKPRTGAQKRSQRSRSRDKRKSDYRADRKGKGKRQ